MMRESELFPALIVAASVLILATVFAMQYWGGLEPCPLCVYQRYPYGVTAGLGVAAFALAGRAAQVWLLALAGLAFLAGGGIAVYHVGVEQHWWAASTACVGGISPNASLAQVLERAGAGPAPRCDEVAWSLFGISLSGYNVIASAALGIASLAAARRLARWRP